jgi:glycosyltransferase involved in cell wall biosynthesis
METVEHTDSSMSPSSADLIKGKATICIVNYKTLDFTRLCLRSIRKFTEYPYEVLVVDNDSQDESTEYIRGLGWIRLIERRAKPGESGGGFAHAAGLDLGLENCNTEFFVSLHSDAFVCEQNWLADLIGYFEGDENVGCVGSGKIELTPRWRTLLKTATDLRTFKRKLLREPDPIGKYRYYNRTICCIYRTAILKIRKLSFLMGRDQGLTGGKKLYFELLDHGCKTVELPSSVMGRYVVHLAHATQVANPQEFTLRKRTVRKCSRLVEKVMLSEPVCSILTDESLDK